MSATRQRLIIYGAQGKIRGIIENRVLRKEIRAPHRCISCAMMGMESIRSELQQQLRTLFGERVWFSASAPAPQGWLQNARVQQLLHDLITALSTQLQLEAVGAAAQGDLQEARRLRARERAVSALRHQQWHLPEVQQDLWRLVWGGSV